MCFGTPHISCYFNKGLFFSSTLLTFREILAIQVLSLIHMPKVLVVFYGYTREESSSMGEALALLASVFWYYRKKMGCKLVLVMETRMYNQSSGFESPSPQLHYGHFHF